MQRLIHDFIMNRTGAKENGYYVAEHGVQYAPFPSPEYEANGFYAAISGKIFIHEFPDTILRLKAANYGDVLCL